MIADAVALFWEEVELVGEQEEGEEHIASRYHDAAVLDALYRHLSYQYVAETE